MEQPMNQLRTQPKKTESSNSGDLFQQLQEQAMMMNQSRSNTDSPQMGSYQQPQQRAQMQPAAVSYDIPELSATPPPQPSNSLQSTSSPSSMQQQQQLAQMQQYLKQMQLQQSTLSPVSTISTPQIQQPQQQAPMMQMQPMMVMPDMSQMTKAISASLERLISDKLDSQLGKITSLLSDMTLRVLASENKLDTLARRLDEGNTLNRDLVQRVEGMKNKQDEVATQLRDIKSTVQSIQTTQQQQMQHMQPHPVQQQPQPLVRTSDYSQPPPMVDIGDYNPYSSAPQTYHSQSSYSPAPVMTAPPPSSLPPPMQPKPQQQPQHYPAQHNPTPSYSGGSGYPASTSTSVRPAVQFDDNLVTDAVNMGYPRYKVIEGLNALYSSGKSCNDINVLLDFLERRK